MVRLLTLMLAVIDPTYFGVRFFVGWFFVALPPLLSILHTSVALQMIGDPNHDVFLVRKELRNRREVISGVPFL